MDMQNIFKVSWGFTVKLITISVGLVVSLSFYMLSYMPLGLGTILDFVVRYTPLFLFFYFWTQRIRHYEFQGKKIIVKRLVGSTVIDLSKVVEIQKPHILLSKLKKHFGNSGIFLFSGSFSTKSLGKFRAFVTDWEKAVFVKTKDASFMFSPIEEGLFLDRLAKLKEEQSL